MPVLPGFASLTALRCALAVLHVKRWLLAAQQGELYV